MEKTNFYFILLAYMHSHGPRDFSGSVKKKMQKNEESISNVITWLKSILHIRGRQALRS